MELVDINIGGAGRQRIRRERSINRILLWIDTHTLVGLRCAGKRIVAVEISSYSSTCSGTVIADNCVVDRSNEWRRCVITNPLNLQRRVCRDDVLRTAYYQRCGWVGPCHRIPWISNNDLRLRFDPSVDVLRGSVRGQNASVERIPNCLHHFVRSITWETRSRSQVHISSVFAVVNRNVVRSPSISTHDAATEWIGTGRCTRNILKFKSYLSTTEPYFHPVGNCIMEERTGMCTIIPDRT